MDEKEEMERRRNHQTGCVVVLNSDNKLPPRGVEPLFSD